MPENDEHEGLVSVSAAMVRTGHAAYLLDRLLCGETVADVELERLGWKILRD